MPKKQTYTKEEVLAMLKEAWWDGYANEEKTDSIDINFEFYLLEEEK